MSPRNWLIWTLIVTALLAPVVAAGFSPQLAWRRTPYIVAGFAGIIALSLMALQPLLADRLLPRIRPKLAQNLHRASGVGILVLIVAHLGGLWLTSAPDVVDALLFQSPTLFSGFGVLALWAIAGAALLACLRGRLALGWLSWRWLHLSVAIIAVLTTILHVLLIEGTMEPITKLLICSVAAGGLVLSVRRTWRFEKRKARPTE